MNTSHFNGAFCDLITGLTGIDVAEELNCEDLQTVSNALCEWEQGSTVEADCHVFGFSAEQAKAWVEEIFENSTRESNQYRP